MKIQKYGMPGIWTKVYNHDLSKTSSFWTGTSGSSVMTDVGSDPSDGKYSRLGSINDYRGDFSADLHLKLVYPNEGWEIEWTQQSDIDAPYTGTNYVKGLNIINHTLNKSTSRFVGLRRSAATGNTYIDACEGTNWWFAIGSTALYSGGIPGWSGNSSSISTHVELYVKMAPDALITTTGVENRVMISPSVIPDNTGFIEFNETKLDSSYAGYLMLIVNNDNSIFKQGNYTSVTTLANEITNSALGKDKLIFITSIGNCQSNSTLDDIMINDFNSIHWKNNNVYSNSRESFFYCGIIHGQYGALKENLSIQTPQMLHYQYDSVQNIISAGYGEYVIVAPESDTDVFNGTPRTSNVLANATALLTSGTSGSINVIFKQNNTTLATEDLELNVMTNMYQEIERYISVPANTNKIMYSVDSNVDLVGLIVRWSGDGSVLHENTNFGRSGISSKKITQNNIPISILDIEEYNYFYENNNYINPSNTPGSVIQLSANNSSLDDMTGVFDRTKTGSFITEYNNSVLYYCCWVKGSVSINISSSNNILYNPNDFTDTSNNTTIAISDNTGKWELIEGFVFPEQYTEELCIEYLKYFKENSFNTDIGTQSIISQTPGNFYFGAKVTDDTQQLSIGIKAITSSSMYSPILYISNSLSFAKDGTLSVVNL